MPATFFWVGNHPGLDFINTEAVDSGGEPLDLLTSWDDVVAWVAEAGLVVPPTDDARRRVTDRDRQAHGALEWARRLRTAARRTLDPEANDGIAATTLSDAVADVPVRLAYSPDALSGTLPVATDDPVDAVRLAVAVAVLDATQLDRSRVRRCESDKCVLVFYDTSKNRSRRWCDMAVCGNRAKAAAHYRRSRRRSCS
jgi:predicted RNA-binding Zn ribbon-like protein